MNSLRIFLLLISLLCALPPGQARTVALRGPVSANRLASLSTANPDMTALDLSEATIEGGLIPGGAFAGTALESVMFPAAGSITIGEGAFMGTRIAELVLPASVAAVGTGAFAACENLRSATIYGARIGDYAFHRCPELTEVELGLSTTVGSHAFEGCAKLRKVGTGNALTAIGDFAFANTRLILARFAECVHLTEVGAWAFANDPDLTVVAFPAHAALGEGVLFNCPSLRSITLPANLAEVPAYAFTGSTGSTGYYTLPDDVESIGAFAYKDTDLGHIVLPPSLKSIGTGAMESTPRLSIIDAGNVSGVPELGDDVWKDVDKSAVLLLVPEDMTADYKAALQWQDFKLDISGVENPEATAASVRAAFDGDNLIIESQGSDIVRVEIFNEAGAAYVNQQAHSALLSIPVGNLPRLMLVRCTLADGTVAILKLTH